MGEERGAPTSGEEKEKIPECQLPVWRQRDEWENLLTQTQRRHGPATALSTLISRGALPSGQTGYPREHHPGQDLCQLTPLELNVPGKGRARDPVTSWGEGGKGREG